jgi:hypothetical protein
MVNDNFPERIDIPGLRLHKSHMYLTYNNILYKYMIPGTLYAYHDDIKLTPECSVHVHALRVYVI